MKNDLLSLCCCWIPLSKFVCHLPSLTPCYNVYIFTSLFLIWQPHSGKLNFLYKQFRPETQWCVPVFAGKHLVEHARAHSDSLVWRGRASNAAII